MYGSRKSERPLAVEIGDRLGQWLADEGFAAAFGIRGRPGWSPSRLALVTVLQRAEKLTDRLAAEAVRARLDWKYLLGLSLEDPGFDHTVLAEFRGKVAEAGLEQAALDALLERLVSAGLVKAGGKQRTDSTHVIAAVAALNRLELAGESVRAALEALAAAHPDWVAARICVSDWARRYGTPMTAWRPPASQARQDELAIAYARDGYALLEAVYAESSLPWLRELPAVDVLRRVLLQSYTRVIHADGREVIKRREKEPEGDGLPPGHARIASPYDLDARWGVKRDTFWLGYKLHVTETCDDQPRCGCPGDGRAGRRGHEEDCPAPAFPNLITCVATTDATVTDNQMTGVIDDDLAGKTLAPGRHYVDSGYLSAALVVAEAARHGIALIGPLLADTSAQARAGRGYARADFAIDYDAQAVTCPQGKTSVSWTPCTQRGTDAIVATFSADDCGPCPVRSLCTTSSRNRRQLTVPPRDVAEAQAAARAEEKTTGFQADYARRAGVEGTMHQAASHGARRARYRGLPKTRLDHAYMACALNLLRLHAYWTGTPLDRRRTSHLARLELGLAALPPNKPPGSDTAAKPARLPHLDHTRRTALRHRTHHLPHLTRALCEGDRPAHANRAGRAGHTRQRRPLRPRRRLPDHRSPGGSGRTAKVARTAPRTSAPAQPARCPASTSAASGPVNQNRTRQSRFHTNKRASHSAWRLTSAVCLATLCPYCPVRRRDNRRPPRHHLRVLTTELEDAGRWPWLSVWPGRRPGWVPGTRQIRHGNGWPGSAGSCTGASPPGRTRCVSCATRRCASRTGCICWRNCRWSQGISAAMAPCTTR